MNNIFFSAVFSSLFFRLAAGSSTVQFELLQVAEPIDQTELIGFLTNAWYTNFFSDVPMDGVSNIGVSFELQGQDTAKTADSNILTFDADLRYTSASNNRTIDDMDLLRLPFTDQEWVYGFSRSLRLTGGALAEFVGPVILLSVDGEEIEAPRGAPQTLDDTTEELRPSNYDLDATLFVVLMAVVAVALLFCYFAGILLLRSISSRK